MNHVNGHKVGLVLGGLLGSLHLIWSALIVLGWAQGLIDFSSYLHMVAPIVMVEPFDAVRALELIFVASVIGYFVGRLLAVIWNKVYKR